MRRTEPLPPEPTLGTALSRLVDNIVNSIFSLRRGAALTRYLLLWTVFLGIWLLTAYIAQAYSLPPLPKDKQTLVAWLAFLFNRHTWPILITLLVPFFTAREAALRYLDDIFELDDPAAAAQFIDSAAFGIRYQTIAVSEGEIIRAHRNSPVYRIGGPGFVMVALDSAILTERADGRPRVIGPTVGRRRAHARLDGFERIRTTFDIRDHTMETSLSGRTLDGIPIEARDIRFVGSIWRRNTEPTLRTPHPFEPYAIHALTYSRTARVSNNRGTTNLSVWHGQLRMMIQNALRDFISRTPLNEFLASISLPEIQERNDIRNDIGQNGTELSLPGQSDPPSLPPFTPRRSIAGRMTLRNDLPDPLQTFARNFTANAAQRGIELKWKGIGAWHHPDDIILSKHIKAWEMNRQNLIRTLPENIRRLQNNAYSESAQNFIRQYILQPAASGLNAVPNHQEQRLLARLHEFLRRWSRDDCESLWQRFAREIQNGIPIIEQTLWIWVQRIVPRTTRRPRSTPRNPSKFEILEQNLRETLGDLIVDELLDQMETCRPRIPLEDHIVRLAKYLKDTYSEVSQASWPERIRLLRQKIEDDCHVS